MNHRINITIEEFKLCKEFSLESAKTQREYRSGGTQKRRFYMICRDTLQGKTAEMMMKKFLEGEPFNITGIDLDFEIYDRGIWDEKDFAVGNLDFSIKSAKWFSKWLLLETKDIIRGDIYDVYVLITVDKGYKSGEVKGFITKDQLLNGQGTLKLKKGELIPNTNTSLDADNYAVHSDHLHNSLEEWMDLLEIKYNF
ncbi:MAG: hypothetical protein ACP5C3_07285 [Methanomicrobiales archaeon]